MLSYIPRGAAPRAAIVLAASLVTAACADDATTPISPALSPATAAGERTFYGSAVPIGRGVARTYVVVKEGAPQELGIELNEGVLDGLSESGGHGDHGNPHAHGDSWDLPLPKEAVGETPFRLVELNWNAVGHGKPYDRPHFDFHFYTISAAERAAISPANPRWVEASRSMPAAPYVPQGYAALSALIGAPPEAVTEPRMGMHWLDVTSPELHGAPFTRTLFMGSWDGRMIFVEPMITLAHLRARTDETIAIPRAAAYAPAGTYPASYRIYWQDAGKRHRVSLADFGTR